MYLKIHNIRGQRIVAVCDIEIVGKILEEGELIIDLIKHQDFYKGEKSDKIQVQKALVNFSSANLIGSKAVDAAISSGIVEKDDVKYINGYPYIQIYKI